MEGFKLVRLQGLGFKRAIAQILQAHPNFGDLNFNAQQEILLAERSVYSSGFSEGLRNCGNLASEIFYDFELAQKQWALEHMVSFSPHSWRDEIVVAQLNHLRPEVLHLQDIFGLSEPVRRKIKDLVPSIKVVVIQKGYPGETRDLSDADILIVSSPVLYDRYKKRGQNPHLVYHSFDSSLNDDRAMPLSRDGFVFAGSTRAPEDRYWMLRKLLRETEIKIWVDEDPASHRKHGGNLNAANWKRYLRDRSIKLIRSRQLGFLRSTLPFFDAIPTVRRIFDQAEKSEALDDRERVLPGLKKGLLSRKMLAEEFPSRCKGSLFGHEYYELLSGAAVVFNMHSTKSGDTVDNMKMFESTGMGACLLTDTGRNMPDLFEEDSEVVTYSSVDEAIEKAKYLLDNPAEAEKIAVAGRAKTLSSHTMRHRCEQINEIIRARL